MRLFVPVIMVALSVGVWGCGSTYSGAPGSPAPTPTPAPAPSAGGAVTINIIGERGSLSFSPNPATLPAGQMVVWHNTDSITHHVVLNNGSLDTGDLTAGASSEPMSIGAGGGPYHCSIHPSMVGTINPAASTADLTVR